MAQKWFAIFVVTLQMVATNCSHPKTPSSPSENPTPDVVVTTVSPTETAVPAPAMFQPQVTYYFAGDIANCEPGHNNILNGKKGHEYVGELLGRLGLDGVSRMFLPIGDIVYFQGSAIQFRNCYDPVYGRWKAFTRPTPGNHEYETIGASGYFSYFGTAAGLSGLGYYSWNPPGDYWHVISGNSNLVGRAKTAYLQWLEQDLLANSARPCTLVYFHYPRFSSGIGGNIGAVTEDFAILYKHHVELLVVGHDHNYERFLPQGPNEELDHKKGVLEIVSGTGGAELRPLFRRRQNSVAFNNTSWGVTVVALGARTYEFRFLPATGSFSDSGSGVCR
ncbi:MAG: alkaline phosphatase [Candidatus Zambryskibacteria bacterium]|nr:alkaline phosphatase [Candidatus Zambryskibacteria bacterium]